MDQPDGEEGEGRLPGAAEGTDGIVDPLAPKPGGMGAPGAYDPTDPMAAIRMAQEALANSPFGARPLSHMGIGANIQEQLAQAAAQIQANDEALKPYGGIAGVMAGAGAGATGAGAAQTPSSPGGSDPLSLIERLAALRDSGALSEEEFTAQKRRILDGGA
ncbi:MAG: SHOCT domain-containing protein [Solirubrobacterales bacterium]